MALIIYIIILTFILLGIGYGVPVVSGVVLFSTYFFLLITGIILFKRKSC